MIVTTTELLAARTPRPRREDHPRGDLAANLCMCTGYVNIVRAVAAGGVAARPRGSAAREPRAGAGRGLGRAAAAAQGGRAPGRRPRPLRRRSGAARACSTRPCCAARTPTRASSPSTRAQAQALPGVFAVLTGAEAAARSGPIRPLIPTTAAVPDYCLAVDRARYVGEPVAAVAAVDRATAEDALERIRVEYEPLPAVVDPEAAIAPGAPLLYPELGTNVVWHDTLTYGDVDGAMARADGVLRERFAIQRYASTPLETFGGIAEYDAGTDVFEFWTNDQRPGLTIAILAGALGVPQSRMRLSCPDIGGGFGNKRRPAYLADLRAARPEGRAAREVDRGPHREPHRAHARVQRGHGRGARLPRRRHRAGARASATSPTRARTSSPRPSTT